MPHNQTHTTSRLLFPLEETTFIITTYKYRIPDLKMLKQHIRIWEKGDVSKTTLYQLLQLPHSLPACNSLNVSSPTFSLLDFGGDKLEESGIGRCGIGGIKESICVKDNFEMEEKIRV